MPSYLSNRKERSDGASLFLRVAQSASIEEVLEDFTKIAAEKGIQLYSVGFKRERLERELMLPNADVGPGRINELAVCVEGGQTQLIVKFRESVESVVMCELECCSSLNVNSKAPFKRRKLKSTDKTPSWMQHGPLGTFLTT